MGMEDAFTPRRNECRGCGAQGSGGRAPARDHSEMGSGGTYHQELVISAPYRQLRETLASAPRTWVITGVAGFIGSNLLQDLLSLGQTVVGVDDFSTGHRANLDEVLSPFDGDADFRMVEGDIRNLEICRAACEGADYVLHHAALGSVPWSMDDPLRTNGVNVDGFVNMLVAAKDAGVKRFVYASSSAVYGDTPRSSASMIFRYTERPTTPLKLTTRPKYFLLPSKDSGHRRASPVVGILQRQS
jgi:NAD dependent epimerase/dehydratase family